MRSAALIRTAAWGVVAAGVAVPLACRLLRLRLRAPVTLAVAGAAPVALCVAVPRSHTRDVAVCVAQMWADVAGYEMPHDDPEARDSRLPAVAPARALSARRGTALHRVRPGPDRQLGAPEAPPWYAARDGRSDPELRRLMVEHCEAFRKDAWGPLYGSLAGNPLAAMPSLHFATSVMAAHLLGEAGRADGAVGWSYALALGFALVYLGEHYVVDLLAGLALVEGVRHGAPLVEGHAAAFTRAVSRLEARAHGGVA